VATAVDTFGEDWKWLSTLIKIGAIAGLSSVVLVLMFGQTRVWYSMSRDGLLPKALARVNPKTKTPWLNTIIVGVVVSLAAAVFDIDALGDLTSVGTLAAFGLVCFSVIWLRYQRPDLPRHFKVPLFPVLPAAGVIVCFWLAWDGANHHIRVWFGWFLLAAVAVYFAYGFWASPLRKKAGDAGTKPAA
jgi:APA family basic amino acid/polyamine antiporter